MGVGNSKSCGKADCRDASHTRLYKDLRREIMIFDRVLWSKPDTLDASCTWKYDRTTPSPLDTCRSLKRGLKYRWVGKKFDCDSWGVWKFKEFHPGQKYRRATFIWYTPIKFPWGRVWTEVCTNGEPGCYCNRTEALVMIKGMILQELSKYYGRAIVDGFVADVRKYLALSPPKAKNSSSIDDSDDWSLASDDEKACLLEKSG